MRSISMIQRLRELIGSSSIAKSLGSKAYGSKARKNRGVRRTLFESLENRRLFVANLVDFLTNEHVDINLQFSGGEWAVGPRNSDEAPAIQYANDEALMYVGSPAATVRPSGSEFNFIGVSAGQPYYRLSQTQNQDVLFMGLAGFGLGNGVDVYNPSTDSKGRVSGAGRFSKATLHEVRHSAPDGTAGNGHFSIWQTSSFGGSIVFLSSYQDGIANPNGSGLDVTDGISSDDAIWVLSGGHAHYNFGFTQPGRYEVDFRLSAYFGDNGNNTTPNLAGFVESEPITLYFSVVSVGQLQFEASSYSVNENSGNATIDVVRVGGSDGRLTVDYATSDGTATAGSDYLSRSGTLEFLDGETRKTITIPILQDVTVEASETFQVALLNPGPSNIAEYYTDFELRSLLGAQSSTIITINDDDATVLTVDQTNLSGTVLSLFSNSGTWIESANGAVNLSASIGTIIKNADGTWNWTHTPTEKQQGQVITITYNDGIINTSETFTIDARVVIFQRGLIYLGATGTSAQSSLATDKFPLLPGQDSSFANYTNYHRGLNGLVVDIAGLPSTTTEAQLLSNLQFARWDGIAAAGFGSLPTAAVPTVSILTGQGLIGSTRIRITFPDNTIQNTWLRVTVLANALTGLDSNDLFYFGNVIGDVGAGNTPTRLRVNATDTGAVRSNQSTAGNSVGVTNIYDINRDGRVNATDTAIVRSNQQTAGIVAPFRAPATSPPPIRPSGTSSFSSPFPPKTPLNDRAQIDLDKTGRGLLERNAAEVVPRSEGWPIESQSRSFPAIDLKMASQQKPSNSNFEFLGKLDKVFGSVSADWY